MENMVDKWIHCVFNSSYIVYINNPFLKILSYDLSRDAPGILNNSPNTAEYKYLPCTYISYLRYNNY